MRATKTAVTVERLREALTYEPETGIFRCNARSARRKAGDSVGFVCGKGYVYVHIDGRHYLAHRLAWLYMTGLWPSAEIDHRNGVRTDNRFTNLRDLTRAENGENQRHANSVSKTGVLGVSPCRKSGKFVATIQVRGKKHYLGSYATTVAAHAAYVEAKRRLHLSGTL